MKNKTLYALSIAFLALLALIFVRCKQDALVGAKTAETGKVYFPDAQYGNNSAISVLGQNLYKVDTATNTVSIAVPIYRGGFSDFESFAVDASVDNSAIAGLIQSGTLPANTVALSPDDYSIGGTDSITYSNGMMQGAIIPQLKVANLQQYSGKTAALGLVINKSSKFTVNDSMNRVVIYFNVDSLLDEAIPPKNLIDNSAWQILKIANNDNVTITLNNDGSALFAGGNGGHRAMYQPVTVQAGKKYKIDMHASGSGATNTWFEVYVGTAAPTQGNDYSDGGIRMGLNTWTGCGTSPFNDELSNIYCTGNGNLISFPTSGTVYVLIKSGGDNLGTAGITISNIEFIRQL